MVKHRLQLTKIKTFNEDVGNTISQTNKHIEHTGNTNKTKQTQHYNKK